MSTSAASKSSAQEVDPSVLKTPVKLGSKELDALELSPSTVNEIDTITHREMASLLTKSKLSVETYTSEPNNSNTRPQWDQIGGVKSAKEIEDEHTTPPPAQPLRPVGVPVIDDATSARQQRLRELAEHETARFNKRSETMRRLLAEQNTELRPPQKSSVEFTSLENSKVADTEVALQDAQKWSTLNRQIARAEQAEAVRKAQAQQSLEENKAKMLAAREERRRQREALAKELADRESVLAKEQERVTGCKELWSKQKTLIETRNELPADLMDEAPAAL